MKREGFGEVFYAAARELQERNEGEVFGKGGWLGKLFEKSAVKSAEALIVGIAFLFDLLEIPFWKWEEVIGRIIEGFAADDPHVWILEGVVEGGEDVGAGEPIASREGKNNFVVEAVACEAAERGGGA